MTLTSKALRPRRGQWLFLWLALVGLYLVLPQFSIFRHSLSYLSDANWVDLTLALVWTMVTTILATLTYYLLAKYRLRFWRTLLVQLAGIFATRILPAGLGGMGINYLYLRSNKHQPAQAASVVAANNLLGILGHLLIVALIVIGWRSQLSVWGWQGRHLGGNWRYAGLLLLVSLLVGLYYRRRLTTGLVAISKQLLAYRRRPLRLAAALLSSIGLTLCNVLSLYYAVLGLHGHVSLASVLIIFTVGIVLGTATPTPGGLGGVEAGLVAGLMAFQMPAAAALATTLVYRLISGWLPVLIGGGAFYVVERAGYLKTTIRTKA